MVWVLKFEEERKSSGDEEEINEGGERELTLDRWGWGG